MIMKVLATRSDFPEKAINLLREKFEVVCYPHPTEAPPDRLLELVAGVDALFCITDTRVTKQVLDAAGKQLKVVATMSIGFDHIDLEECKKRGIRVCNGINPTSISCVAEFTIGLLLAVTRKIARASSAIQRGEWKEYWTPTWYLGRGLTQSKVGIVGMGRIGQSVLDRVLPFGVSRVYYYDVIHPIKPAEEKGAVYLSFDELLKESDHIIVTCNLTEQSRHLFNARAFKLMKPTATFINTSRGGVVDQAALLEALKQNQIGAAGLDVMYPEPLPTDHELLSLPNVVLTPHIGAADSAGVEQVSLVTAQNIIAVLEGREPVSPVC